jgi:hypothetical protein
MAAGTIKIKVIQLQFLPNQSLNAVLKTRMRMMEMSDHGNNKNHEALSKRRAIAVNFGSLKCKKNFSSF